jgi:hypothetical protein
LLFSPFVLTFAALLGDSDHYVTWRPLYAFPFSFMLVAGAKESVEFFMRKRNLGLRTRSIKVAVFAVVLLLSLVPFFPFRGRMWFLLYRPTSELSLQRLDVTSQWLADNYNRGISCLLVADHATGTALAAPLGMPPVTDRLESQNAFELFSNKVPFVEYLQANKFCGFLVAIPSEVATPPVSSVGQLSGHWHPLAVKKNLVASGNIDETLNSLTAAGWSRTFVPPFYWLYQSPQISPKP